MEYEEAKPEIRQIHKSTILLCILIIVLSFCATLCILLATPIKSFPRESYVVFSQGETLGRLASSLEERGYIYSDRLFIYTMRSLGGDRRIAAGTYYFDRPISIIQMAMRFRDGDRNQKSIRITIREGYTRKDMARVFSEQLEGFDASLFLEKTKDKEGFLFPDTYFFYTTDTEDDVIQKLERTYKEKTKDIFRGLTKEQEKSVMILASLLEKEGNTIENKKIISGILQKRLAIGMPLQVDATIVYIKESTSAVTYKDLLLPSLYNTYKHKGLPPAPIASPGMVSIEAALSPEKTEYLYYLTGKDGRFYYAQTLDGHIYNKQKYLK